MYVYGAHALQYQDAEGLKTQVWESLVSGNVPRVPPTLYASPQLLDLTQQGIFFEPLVGRQGPVPALSLNRQDDPTQIAALVWRSSIPPPVLTGAVPKLLLGQPQTDPTQISPQFQASLFRVISPSGRLSQFFWIQPQPDTSNNPSDMWTNSTFSPSAPSVPNVAPVASGVGAPWFPPYRPPKKQKPVVKLKNVVVIPQQPGVEDKRVYRYISDLSETIKNLRIQAVKASQAIELARKENKKIEANKKASREDEFLILLSIMEEDEKEIKRQVMELASQLKRIL